MSEPSSEPSSDTPPPASRIPPNRDLTAPSIERTTLCEYCEADITWAIREAFDDAGLIYCAHCRWMCGFRRDDEMNAVVTSMAGGPGLDGPADPIQGILDLAVTVRPTLVWTTARRDCGACGPDTVIHAVQRGSQQRFDYELCVSCGDVVVVRRLAATPRMARVDAGNLFTAPRDGGPLWLVRGLRLF